MALSRREIAKDVLQQTTEAATTTVGQVGAIVLAAFRDVTRAVGDLGTEIFEIREAAARAGDDDADPLDTASAPARTPTVARPRD